ncbi:hypothetical protein NQZ79_g2105 [Umbelopsis isabellina]|nr:hypothetical protein NQZ79_g2105 [Umbelopsis isabellina]
MADVAQKRLNQLTNIIHPPVTVATFRAARPATASVDYTPLNPVNFLLRSAQIYTHKPAVIYNGQQCSYGQLAIRVKNFAIALVNEYKISPGDKVAILCPNTQPILEAHFAIPAAKGVIVALNHRLNASEVEYIVKHSDAKMFIIDSEYQHLIPASLDIKVLVIHEGAKDDPYEAMLKLGEHGHWSDLELAGDERDVFGISYTSGSTGRPKGVRHAYRFPWAITAVAGTHVMLRKIDYGLIWHHLKNDGVTHYNGAPTLQTEIVNHPDAVRLDHPVTVMTGGSYPSSVLLRELERLNIWPRHIYGLTETFGPTSATYEPVHVEHLTDEERYAMLARQGFGDMTADEIRVMDQDTGKDVPMDGKTMGEITMRGNIVMKDYYKDPDATSKATKHGVFWTGDLAVRHPDGAIELKDRQKDIVISGGENISSIEIESTILFMDDVLEVAVVAGPDKKWGEHPVAFVVPKRGRKVTSEQIFAFCKTRLAGFKVKSD